MIAERPNAGAVRHPDWCGVIRRSRIGCFVPIVAHRITPTDIVVEFRKYPHVSAGAHHFPFVQVTRAVLVGGIFRANVPSARTLLCKSGLGLTFQGRVRGALVSPLLSFDQVFGCTSLEQASSFETHGACVGMSPEVLNHGVTGGIADASWI